MLFEVKSKKFGDQLVRIDDEAWPQVKEYHWVVMCEKTVLNLKIFARVTVCMNKTKTVYLDQLILGIEKMPVFADIIHRDGDAMNHCKANLRYFGKKLEEENNNAL